MKNMGNYGTLWKCMRKYEKVWKGMESNGKIWKCMRKYGKVCEGMGKYR